MAPGKLVILDSELNVYQGIRTATSPGGSAGKKPAIYYIGGMALVIPPFTPATQFTYMPPENRAYSDGANIVMIWSDFMASSLMANGELLLERDAGSDDPIPGRGNGQV